MAAFPEDPPMENPPSEAEEASEPESAAAEALEPSFPTGRVKRIMRMDPEIKKVSSEAMFLISLSAELFVESLAEKAATAVTHKRRKTIKLEHLRSAVCSHSPTADFLLDCLSWPSKPTPETAANKKDGMEKPLPAGARRIDQFFSRSSETVR